MHPVLFTLPGGLQIHSYGFALSLAFTIGVFGAIQLGRRDGAKVEIFYDLAILSIISAVVGSRLEYVRTHWAQKFADAPMEIFNIRRGGYVFFGGLLLTILVDLLYLKRKRAPPGIYADIAAIFIALGVGITRLGCFGAGCCYGRPSALPWAVSFPAGAIAPAGIARHPTQLYESAYAFALATFLVWWRGRRHFPGEGLLIFGVAYSLLRFVNEGLRGDGERGWVIEGLLTNGQATGLGVIAVCGLLWAVLYRRAQRTA